MVLNEVEQRAASNAWLQLLADWDDKGEAPGDFQTLFDRGFAAALEWVKVPVEVRKVEGEEE